MGKLVKPYVNTGMIDLRLIDTETAFRIITFLDERLLESPEEGAYIRKPGVDSVHTCNFELDDDVYCSNGNISKDDEYTLFTPRSSFDALGDAITQRAIAQLKYATTKQ
ncbi:hypothetical protein BEWA_028070 [Theileria equi strain WA]|uniref:Uncharacterized protein n=1 Tax=Theileria equi strain WA TaxID=1537102 RepID=L0AXJ5_THEEQ|nr:hypothetical protein BEWA_028070 [Theileria equi strain WA]AFZ79958.1 hypothetical protein BEWA_028070 [Theileria equi strain WA]|eukprot:XP_004829624.1 hypothetical protein BEWA_028070 [Theileria equi strain WA]